MCLNFYTSHNYSIVTGTAEEDNKPVSTSTNMAYGMISKTVSTTANVAYGMVPYDQQPSGKEGSPTYEIADKPSPSSAIPTPASAATSPTTQQQCHETEEPEYY